jgi:Cu-processing system ATP-binding protein
MIEISGLSRRYGRLQVLRELELGIAPGRVTAILGPNGAGKTTLIKCILGLVRPDAGTIRVNGSELDGSSAYRRDIGYMPQVPRYPENLTVRELFAMLKDLRGEAAADEAELVALFDLEPQLEKPFKALSGGNRQRVSAAVALLFEPSILILDEPTAGLDPLSSSIFKDRIRQERERGRTIVLTGHVMSEIEELADVVVYLLDGRVYFEEPVADLLARTGEPSLERALARVMLRVA